MIAADILAAIAKDPRSGREIARKAGISEGTIRHMVKGGEITLENAEKLAKALGFRLVMRGKKLAVDTP